MVFNLTANPLHFRGREIPANGGSLDFDMDYVPSRDQKLVDGKKISFGSLPKWFIVQQAKASRPAPEPAKSMAKAAPVETSLVEAAKDIVKEPRKK